MGADGTGASFGHLAAPACWQVESTRVSIDWISPSEPLRQHSNEPNRQKSAAAACFALLFLFTELPAFVARVNYLWQV
jgi:hypothetical protein